MAGLMISNQRFVDVFVIEGGGFPACQGSSPESLRAISPVSEWKDLQILKRRSVQQCGDVSPFSQNNIVITVPQKAK